MTTTEELFYDPVGTFADVFADGLLAVHLGEALTCKEVNVLVGLLAFFGKHGSADFWLTAHLNDCDEPQLH